MKNPQIELFYEKKSKNLAFSKNWNYNKLWRVKGGIRLLNGIFI